MAWKPDDEPLGVRDVEAPAAAGPDAGPDAEPLAEPLEPLAEAVPLRAINDCGT